MIQGGDINSRDNDPNNDGHGGPGWTVDAEFNDISHKRGIFSMARSPRDLNSAGSQFFICVKDSPWLDGQYTVFGEVIELFKKIFVGFSTFPYFSRKPNFFVGEIKNNFKFLLFYDI